MTATRIYYVSKLGVDGENAELVRGTSKAQVLRYMAELAFAADVATQDQLVTMASDGQKVLDATAQE